MIGHIGEDLVVDDEQDILKMLSYNIEKEGYKVYCAEDGEKAVELTKLHSPSLILMDLMMPVMDGISALKLLRQREALQGDRTRVLMVTAHAMTGDRERFLSAGADGYVSKPMSQVALQKEIERVLNVRHSNEPGASNAVGEFAQ